MFWIISIFWLSKLYFNIFVMMYDFSSPFSLPSKGYLSFVARKMFPLPCFSCVPFCLVLRQLFGAFGHSSVSINIFTMKKLKIPRNTIYIEPPSPRKTLRSRQRASIYIWKLSLSSITTAWGSGLVFGGLGTAQSVLVPTLTIRLKLLPMAMILWVLCLPFCQSGSK